jgi:hypothetical protein
VELLHRDFASYVPASTFRSLFQYAWKDDADSPAMVVEANGRIVGALGTLYSTRVDADGTSYRVCAISSWFVLAEYRMLGLALLMRVLNQRGVTIISTSPNQTALPINLKAGMAKISEGFHLYPGWLGIGGLFRAPHARMVTDRAVVRRHLPAVEQRIFDDHAPYRCGHYVFETGGSVAYVVTKRRTRVGFPRVPISEVLYVTPGTLLMQHFPRVVRGIALHERSVGVAFDGALLGAEVPQGGRFRERIRVGKGPALAQAVRDSLYTEMVIFD